MLADVKSLYAEAEARANTTIKQEEDLNAHLLIVSERERAVVEKEQDLQPHHEAVDTRLECELKGSHPVRPVLTLVRLPWRRSRRNWRRPSSQCCWRS
jgi:hypothetical protein